MDAAHEFTISAVDDRVVVAGEVDAHRADELRAHLDTNRPAVVRVDLAAVTFMDSSGLRVLLDAHQRREGGGLVLVDPSRAVRRLIEIVGLTKHLRIETT